MGQLVILWLALLVIFLIVEAACPVHLVSIWFAVGSLAALLADMLGAPIWLQATLFVLVSGALLAMLWPLARKYINPNRTATNVDALIGAVGVVTAAIDNVEAVGQVKLNGMEWSARSTNGEDIPAGCRVKVDKIQGVKVFVTPAEVPAGVK